MYQGLALGIRSARPFGLDSWPKGMVFAVALDKMDDRTVDLFRAEHPMKNRKPDKTIAQLFEEFLANQKARLSPRTYTKYGASSTFTGAYLESYWPDHSEKEYKASPRRGHLLRHVRA